MSEEIILKSEALTAAISLTGAEITRLTAPGGKELLWEGLPSVWGHVSPLLFPFPGTLRGGFYISAGRRIPLPAGGAAQTAAFSPLSVTNEQAILQLELPLEGYPFEGRLLAAYTLRGPRLMMEYDVVNAGYLPLYYGLGRQMAFSFPEGTEFVRLCFDQPESPEVWRTEGGYPVREPGAVGPGVRQIALGGRLFSSGQLYLSPLRGGDATLLSVSTGRRIRMDFDGFSWLRLWKRPRAPFVSVEPWTTPPDTEEADCLLSRKAGIEMLPPGKTKQYRQTVTVLEV